MGLLKKIVFTLLLLSFSSAFASKIDKAYQALYIFDYFKAKKIFYSSLNSNKCEASFGLATIFHRNDNPFHQLDSAYKFCQEAILSYNFLDKEDKIKLYKKYLINDSTLAKLSFTVDSLAFYRNVKNCNINSLEFFEIYLNYHSQSVFHSKALLMRDSVVFEYSKEINASTHFIYMLNTYPESYYKKEIQANIDRSNYQEYTRSKSPEVYFSFIKNFPNSDYIIDAENQIYKYYSLYKSESGLYKFITSFPNNSNVSNAWKELYSLHVTEYSAENLSEFLSQYPNFPFKETIEQDIKNKELFLIPFESNNLFGFIDSLGNVIISNQYESVEDFSEGLCVAEKGEKFGYINKAGNTIIPFVYDEAESFKNGLAIVKKGDDFFAIDHTGMQKTESYGMMSDFNENVSVVRFATKDSVNATRVKTGVVNKLGKLILSTDYEQIGDFNNGLSIVMYQKKCGVIDKNGKIIIPIIYDWLNDFENGLARAKLDGKMGIIDLTGKWIIQPEYSFIEYETSGLYRAIKGNVYYGFINSNGCVIKTVDMPFDLKDLEEKYTNGKYIKMKTEDGQTLCDTNGVKLFPGDVYDEMYLPSSGLIRCSKDDSYGFVDEKKNEIVKFIYNDAFDFFGNIALVQKKDKWMFIDKKGKTVLAVKCNEAEKLGKGYYVLSSDSISSLYNSKAEKLLSFVTKKTNSSGAAILIEKPEIEFYNNSILSIDFNNKKAFYSLTRKSYIWKEEGFTE